MKLMSLAVLIVVVEHCMPILAHMKLISLDAHADFNSSERQPLDKLCTQLMFACRFPKSYIPEMQ
jgi:hypothetical protein